MGFGPLLLSEPERMVIKVVAVDCLQSMPTVVVQKLRRRDDTQRLFVRRRFVVVENSNVGVRVDRLSGRKGKKNERYLFFFSRGNGQELRQRAF